MNLKKEIKLALAKKKFLTLRPAKDFIKYDYLVPGGPYEEQWDWDGFFVGMSLASEINSLGLFLKNWSLNYLTHIQPNGFVPGLITPRGIDKRLKHVKPFLAQGVYFSSKFLNDFSWVKQQWKNLNKVISYREKTYFYNKYNLGAWHDSMESGADNNVACLNYPNGSVIAVDLNTFLFREYWAMELIAKKLKKQKEADDFKKKKQAIKKAILKYLWDKKNKSFYNLDIKTGSLIKRNTYSNFVPLWAGIAPKKLGKEMINKYLINPDEMRAKFGIRTLSKKDREYNQANIIKPHSNWQGPVWPIANYLYMHALLNYGYKKEAEWLAKIISEICLKDINKSGGLHENYNADTGKPLAAPNFVSWNLLVGQMIDEVETGFNPFKL